MSVNSHILTLRAAWNAGLDKIDKYELAMSKAPQPRKMDFWKKIEEQKLWNRQVDDLIRIEIDKYPSYVRKINLQPSTIKD